MLSVRYVACEFWNVGDVVYAVVCVHGVLLWCLLVESICLLLQCV